MTLDEIKTYCRIDGNADDEALMTIFLPAAEGYLSAAVDNPAVLDYAHAPYRLMVLLLINHWYSRRDMVAVGSAPVEMPLMWRGLMQQLQTTPVLP